MALRTRRSVGALLLLSGLFTGLLGLVAPGARADATGGFTTPPGVTVVEGGENCNGVVPTGSSGNTEKHLLPTSVLTAGGSAQYAITFPADEGNVGDFEIVDCVLLLSPGADVKDFDEVLSEVTFKFANNASTFELAFAFTIPDSAVNGDQICNVAKTTASPSHSPAGNRKAGPACFVVGGAARVEKHDASTGDLLDGATFSIHDCVNPAPDPALQPIIVSLEDANGDPVSGAPVAGSDGLVSGEVSAAAMGFNGPSGATCQVTETAPPTGYLLPDVATATVAMGLGEQVVTVFDDEPVPTTTTEPPTTTTEPPTTTTVAPTTTTVAPTTTTAAPVVLGTEQTQPPTTPPATVLGIQLARTGSETQDLLFLAAALLIVGGLLVLVSERLPVPQRV